MECLSPSPVLGHHPILVFNLELGLRLINFQSYSELHYFRFIMIKYSQGLVQNPTRKNKNSLFNLLYITSFFSWSSGFYLISIIKATVSTKIAIQHDKMRIKTGIGLVFLLAFLLMFLNVQYTKRKRHIVYKIQYNILTFNQSFYSFTLFFLCDLLLKYLRENESDLAVFLFFISKLIFFHWLIPCMILRNLKLTMPVLFSKNKIHNVKFYISGYSITPRQQVLLPFKQFVTKARWGSEVKFQIPNQPEKIYLKNSLSTVECWILVMMICWECLS